MAWSIYLLLVGLPLWVFSSDVAFAGEERTYRHGIAFSGELKYPPGFAHFEFVNPDAPRGGTLVLSVPRNFDTLSPGGQWQLAWPAPQTNGSAGGFYEGLFAYRYEEMDALYGLLVKEVRLGDDGRTLFLRLHPEARWHDGVPITARDVQFSLERRHTVWAIEILGEREIALTMEEQLTMSNTVGLSMIGIVPAHYWEDRDITAATMEPPLGSGPYRVAEVRQGRYIRFERVADYWGRDLAVNRGLYNFDEIRYDVYLDAVVAREAFRKGLIDVWFEGDTRYWSTGFDFPARDRGWVVMDTYRNTAQIGVGQCISLNARRDRFKDRRVREALTLAMDLAWQNRTLYLGLQAPVSSYFAGMPPMEARGLPGADELVLLEPFRDQLPGRVFTDVFEHPPATGRGRHRPALLRARALLADAGWRIRDDVLVDGSGEPFEIEFMTHDPGVQRSLLPYIDALKLLGISGRFRLVDPTHYWRMVRNFDYDAILNHIDNIVPPSTFVGGYFHSDWASLPGTDNAAGVADPVVDALIEIVHSSRSLAEMMVPLRALDRVLLWGFHNVLMWQVPPSRIVYWDKFGRPEAEDIAAHIRPFPHAWWYDAAKAARIKH